MPDFLFNSEFLIGALVAIATFATIVTAGMPLVAKEPREKRMRAVAVERERIRAREREKLAANKGSLRQEPKAYMKQVVERFNLSSWLGTEKAKEQMMRAGFRGSAAETGFLFFRLVVPIGTLIVGAIYVFLIGNIDWPLSMKAGAIMLAAYVGLKAPELYISNTIAKRQKSISRAFPDAMDLLLICVESGMSIEQAFRKVSQEIGIQSIPLAEELTLTTAELSYLPDRRAAYENLSIRTGVDSIKQITTVLTQAEKYGTPLGTALRVLGQESREHRLLLAEQKAAALPPKLTVPMILFFLPVLFAVIITPAAIQVSRTM
jgi:tight adherence protein C